MRSWPEPCTNAPRATPGAALLLILRSGARVWGGGVVAGAGGAILLRQVVSSQLYGVSATDPTIFLVAVLLLAGVSAVATAFPAWYATRMEPAIVLRKA